MLKVKVYKVEHICKERNFYNESCESESSYHGSEKEEVVRAEREYRMTL